MQLKWLEDFIVLAQRGTNWSDSNLTCPPLSYPEIYAVTAAAPGEPTDWRQNIDRATAACWRRLAAQGHDLAAYTSEQSAMDVAALRIALRIPAWSVYGVSYGTRFALTLMRDHPEGIKSVILDSVYPPVRTDPDGDPKDRSRAVPIWSCSRWGLPCHLCCQRRGALLPHHFNLAAGFRPVSGVISVALSLESPPADVIRHRVLRGARTFLQSFRTSSHPAI